MAPDRPRGRGGVLDQGGMWGFCRRVSRLIPLPVLFVLAFVGPAAAQDSVRAFVSVEPFEFRVEAIAKVGAYGATWGLEGETIGAAAKQAVLDRLLELFEEGVAATLPRGAEVRFDERSAKFLVPDPERGYAIDDRSEIPVAEALVGLTLSAPVRGVSAFDLEWRWFAPGQERLVLEIASRGRPSARLLTPAERKVSWKFEGEVPAPALQPVPSPVRREIRPMRILLGPGIAMVLAAAWLAMRRQTQAPLWTGALALAGVGLAALAVGYRIVEIEKPRGLALQEVIYALLRNTYHAFDFRDESTVYDTLAASVTGPLLERVYLEVRESLELENIGGPRVRVYEIALRDCEEAGAAAPWSGAIRTKAEWVAIGEVTHWGHTHERTNRYEAEMTLRPEEGTWKIEALELLDEERIQKTTRRTAAAKP